MLRKKLNPWSIVAALCAVGLCPLFSIAAILAGVRALVEIKSRGDTRGVRVAWLSILVGAVITGAWGGGLLWWNTNVREMIEQGPIHAIVEGQDGNVELFTDYFSSDVSREDAASFLQSLHARYGTLHRGNLDETIEESPVDGENLFLGMVPVEAELTYALVFDEDKMVRLRTKYELFKEVDEGNSFVNRFVWFVIDDEKNGTLVYPVGATVEETHSNE
ncbi:DUF4190 domain-containing protein [bacterium]|nr:DUF4190 domain-containing protein [bacterium]